jgi:propionyl-CoA carboxylase beta chain
VPKVTVITRKAYGGAYCVMGSKHIRTDVNLAFPTAEIAVMGAQGAVNILYSSEIEGAADPEGERARRVEEYQAKFANPFSAAERGYVDEVILPRLLRRKLVAAFSLLQGKRDWMPTKKHGNIPL